MGSSKRLYVLASVLAVILIAGAYYISKSLAYGVYAGNKLIAVVRDVDTVDKAVQDVKRQMKEDYGIDVKFKGNLDYKRMWARDLTDYSVLKKNILRSLGYKVRGVEILVDGKSVGVVKSDQVAKDIFVELLRPYALQKSSGQISGYYIKERVSFKEKDVNPSDIVSENQMVNMLKNGTKNVVKTYTIKQGDSLWSIAREFDTYVDTLKKYNPGITESLKPGDVIKLNAEKKYVTVVTTRDFEREQQIPYDVKVTYDPKAPYGSIAVKQKGENGRKVLHVIEVMENGVKVAEKAISESIVRNPVTEVVVKGTNRMIASGTFLYPSRGGISSRFGMRWGRMHTGVDIAASYGSPVEASDAGKVIFAGWESGYGKLIKIDHENGYVTYYGHLSSILVKVGQRVAKGDVIGKVGATGHVTGPHLHFEVRKDGIPQNPMNYLK